MENNEKGCVREREIGTAYREMHLDVSTRTANARKIEHDKIHLSRAAHKHPPHFPPRSMDFLFPRTGPDNAL